MSDGPRTCSDPFIFEWCGKTPRTSRNERRKEKRFSPIPTVEKMNGVGNVLQKGRRIIANGKGMGYWIVAFDICVEFEMGQARILEEGRGVPGGARNEGFGIEMLPLEQG